VSQPYISGKGQEEEILGPPAYQPTMMGVCGDVSGRAEEKVRRFIQRGEKRVKRSHDVLIQAGSTFFTAV